MVSLLVSIALLIVGYLIYSKIVEKIFRPDERKTPAYANADGVDFVPLPVWKAFLIQLLNIAGTGPIFGALMGAVFGPIVFVWIVLGCILGGGVHDYFSGMISCRNKGASIAELSGKYLGKPAMWIMRAFSILLLVLVGAVFVTSPAALLAKLTPEFLDANFWTVVIIIYYFLATLLPVDKLIGNLYPVFGACLIFMTLGILLATLIFYNSNIPEITVGNIHPDGTCPWPFMFITVACGAISGFHSTQSPIIAKCIKHEKYGRPIFYGSMVTEGIIALAWAAAGVAFYEGTGGLQQALAAMGESGTVYDISMGMLGLVGGALAIIGVVACPITSGDTAFRSARLILAEIFHLKQKPIKNRLLFAIPLLGVGAILTQLDFDVLWRYFSWANQTLAMLGLCVIASYLVKNAKNKWYCLIAAIPGTFMAAVTCTYILVAEEGFQLSEQVAYPIGIAFAVLVFCWYMWLIARQHKNEKQGITTSDDAQLKAAGKDVNDSAEDKQFSK